MSQKNFLFKFSTLTLLIICQQIFSANHPVSSSDQCETEFAEIVKTTATGMNPLLRAAFSGDSREILRVLEEQRQETLSYLTPQEQRALTNENTDEMFALADKRKQAVASLSSEEIEKLDRYDISGMLPAATLSILHKFRPEQYGFMTRAQIQAVPLETITESFLNRLGHHSLREWNDKMTFSQRNRVQKIENSKKLRKKISNHQT